MSGRSARMIYVGNLPGDVREWEVEDLFYKTIFRNPNKIKPYVVPNPERCNVPAAAIFASSDSVIIVDVNAPDAHVALHKWKPNTPDSHGTPFLFQHGKATHGSAGGALMRMLKGPAGDWQFPQALAFPTSGIRSSAVVAATCDKEIITGGHADNSVKLISSDGAITIETAARHCAPVTCLALSPDSNHLVTGSQDTTLILWRIHRAPLSQLSNISKSSTSAATTACTNSPHSGRDLSNIVDTSRRSRIEGPLQVLRGHLKAIVCCGVDSDMGIVVSCSQSSGVLLHSIRGRLIRKLEAVEADAIYHTLKLKDGQDITSVALNKDNTNLLVSTADKQLIIFTDPDLSLNAGQMLPSNLEGNNLTPHSK